MDIRTSQVIAAIDPLAVDLLLNLLPGPLSEMALIESTSGATQPTGHRKMRRLGEAGIVRQDTEGRGKPWRVSAPQETAVLLQALFDLVDGLEDLDSRERQDSRDRLQKGRRGRLRLAAEDEVG